MGTASGRTGGVRGCLRRLYVRSAPLAKTQPGFYRMMLGDFEVTALDDGVVPYQTTRILPTAAPEQIKAGLADRDPKSLTTMTFLAQQHWAVETSICVPI
jgi:hypothetical protein